MVAVFIANSVGRTVTAKAPPARAWSSSPRSGPTTQRRTRSPLGNPYVEISASHVGSCGDWDERIERWDVSLDLTFRPVRRSQRRNMALGPQLATVAAATLYRTNLKRNPEFAYELDNISYDLGVIGWAIDSSSQRPAGSPIDMNTDILIAADVVVDGFWRGGRLGPALVFLSADLLRADAVFLSPYALATRIGDDGRCYSSYEAPRPGKPAQAKVRSAWRRAGFRALEDGVVWTPTTSEQVARAHAHLERVSEAAATAHARAWWRRRVRRQLGSVDAEARPAPTRV